MKNCFLIVNYNDYKSTSHLVDNIKEYTCIDEIVIVDNHSTQEEIERLHNLQHEKVTILFSDQNYGYSSAINMGARYLINKYEVCKLIISNSDVVIVCEDDLIKLLNCLDDKTIGLVGPQILELGGISRGMKRMSPLKDLFSYRPFSKSIFKNKEYLYEESHYENERSDVDILSSSFFLITSENLQRINYMDEQIFLYYEDFILSHKVRNLNLRIVIQNDVKIKHNYSISVDKSFKQIEKYCLFKESQYYYHTTYNKAHFFEKMMLKISKKIGIIIYFK